MYESISNADSHHPTTTPALPKQAVPLFTLLAPLHTNSTSAATVAPAVLSAPTLPSSSTSLPQLSYDLGNLNRYGGDLASFLDISLDAPIDAWLGSWDQVGGTSQGLAPDGNAMLP